MNIDECFPMSWPSTFHTGFVHWGNQWWSPSIPEAPSAVPEDCPSTAWTGSSWGGWGTIVWSSKVRCWAVAIMILVVVRNNKTLPGYQRCEEVEASVRSAFEMLEGFSYEGFCRISNPRFVGVWQSARIHFSPLDRTNWKSGFIEKELRCGASRTKRMNTIWFNTNTYTVTNTIYDFSLNIFKPLTRRRRCNLNARI